MEEAYKIEKLLGCRKASSEVGVSGEMEYLVKWSYYSYRDLEWMLASTLNSIGESSKVTAYKRKFGGAPSPDPDDLFPREYLEIERIFATKESEEWVEYDHDGDDPKCLGRAHNDSVLPRRRRLASRQHHATWWHVERHPPCWHSTRARTRTRSRRLSTAHHLKTACVMLAC